MDILVQKIENLLRSHKSLSESERDLLIGLLPRWPQSRLKDLEKTLVESNFELSPVSPVQTSSPPKHDVVKSNVVDLRHRLAKDTVNFSNKPKETPKSVVPVAAAQTQKSRLKLPQPVISPKTSRAPVHKVQSVLVHQNSPVVRDRAKQAPHKPANFTDLNHVLKAEDFNRIDLPTLRYYTLSKSLPFLLQKIAFMVHKQGILAYDILVNMERSPANQIFIQTGLFLMNDPAPERALVYKRAQNFVKAKYGDSLTEDEFNAFSEFKNRLEKLS